MERRHACGVVAVRIGVQEETGDGVADCAAEMVARTVETVRILAPRHQQVRHVKTVSDRHPSNCIAVAIRVQIPA